VDTFHFVEKESTMAKKRPRSYPPAFRLNIIDLARAGRRVEELASEFSVGPQTIRNWLKRADVDAGLRKDGLTSAEHEEITKLRRENRQLKIEREILGKAAAWFARETDSIPPKSSNS
jgi:transposase